MTRADDVGDFGVDPEDSARLLELRQAIDDHLGWDDEDDNERGDYVERVRQAGARLRLVTSSGGSS